MAKKWYVIHTYSGFEDKVKKSLEERVRAESLDNKILQVLVPSEDVVEIKKGKKQIVRKRFFPGYILVQMDISSDDVEEENENLRTLAMIKNTPKVTGFVGPGARPAPISDEDVEVIVRQMESGAESPRHSIQFQKGETVRVVSGPFMNFTGIVDDVNMDKNTLKVMVTIFGRKTSVELGFLQVEAI